MKTAKADGIIKAVAHHTHYGYSNRGQIRQPTPEMGNSDMTMCVELIGQRSELELFCCKHGDLLENKVIVYKHLEHWAIYGHEVTTHDATARELKADAKKGGKVMDTWLSFRFAPTGSSSERLEIWKKLKSAGSLPYQDFAFLLPADPASRRIFEGLKSEVWEKSADISSINLTTLGRRR